MNTTLPSPRDRALDLLQSGYGTDDVLAKLGFSETTTNRAWVTDLRRQTEREASASIPSKAS